MPAQTCRPVVPATDTLTPWRIGSHQPWREAQLALLGLMALALGVLVYAVDRDPSHHAWLPMLPALHQPGRLGDIFGIGAGSLPSLLHACAFGLLSAAALPARSTAASAAAWAWGPINVAFELGQHPAVSPLLAAWLDTPSGPAGVAHWLAGYFTHGRFDPMDIVGALAGALLAWALARTIDRRGGPCHDAA